MAACRQARSVLQLYNFKSGFNRHTAGASTRSLSSTPCDDDISKLLSKPFWSVRSLLPPASEGAEYAEKVSLEQLSHLLRLSALPQPANEAEQKELLETLQSQIHFVKEIQKVDTTNVVPLAAIRDETPEAIAESRLRVKNLKDAFAQEKPVGRNGRIQRQKASAPETSATEQWNPLEMASQTAGRYFVVQKKKKDQGAILE